MQNETKIYEVILKNPEYPRRILNNRIYPDIISRTPSEHNNQNIHPWFIFAIIRHMIYNPELRVWATYLKAYKPTSANKKTKVNITIIAPMPIPPYIAMLPQGINDKNPK